MACPAVCMWRKVYFIFEVAGITSLALVCDFGDCGVVESVSIVGDATGGCLFSIWEYKCKIRVQWCGTACSSTQAHVDRGPGKI